MSDKVILLHKKGPHSSGAVLFFCAGKGRGEGPSCRTQVLKSVELKKETGCRTVGHHNGPVAHRLTDPVHHMKFWLLRFEYVEWYWQN